MHCRKFHHAHQRVTPDLKRLPALKEAATGKRVESRCAYLYWLSALVPRDGSTGYGAKSQYPPHLGVDAMMPLMFTAGLLHDSDLKSTVTILQHVVRRLWSETKCTEVQRTCCAPGGPGESHPLTCQRVEQTLALFPY